MKHLGGLTMSSRVAILFVAASMAVLTLAAAGTAQAADSWVYVVVRDRVCGDPSLHVRGILANAQPTGWTTSSWDNGDNIIYPKVRLGQRNTVSAQVACYKRYWWGWSKVGYRTVQGQFTPTALKQTFWIG
jgi:hypothetical protein